MIRPFTTVRVGGPRGGMIIPAQDPATLAYIAATGATDTAKLEVLVRYLRTQSLWDHVRFASFKSAQNKGSGTTVYALGGWTSNNITLVNGPTWGAGGVSFDATDDRATWDLTGIGALTTLHIFSRQAPVGASSTSSNTFGREGFGNQKTGGAYLINTLLSSYLTGETVAGGVSNNTDHRRIGTSSITWTAGEDLCLVAKYSSTGGGLWKNKTEASSYLKSPADVTDLSPAVTAWSTNSILNLNAAPADSVYAGFVATTRKSLLLCKTSLTQAQREAITDYLNAL